MSAKSYAELVTEAKERIREIGARDAVRLRSEKPEVIFLDVREPQEWAMAHVPGAVFIPRGELEDRVEQEVPRDRTVVIYCARGNRSALAADTLQQMGYADVHSLAGGIGAWYDAGGELED